MASCIERRWRTAAIREDLAGRPRLVALGGLGAVLLVAGVVVPSSTTALALCGTGIVLLVLFLVFPLVSSATLGPGSLSFSRAERSRLEATDEVYGPYTPLLVRVATDISGRSEVAPWVEEALGLAHADAGLIPRRDRLAHVLCHLVRVIRSATWREDAGGRTVAGGALIDLPFEERAAVVLTRTASLDVERTAGVLHEERRTVERLLAGAARRVPLDPSGRP